MIDGVGIENLTREEVTEAIEKLKNERAPEQDWIAAELQKHGDDLTYKVHSLVAVSYTHLI